MARITSRIEHTSGIPLGGVGTGSVEIRPDGYFHEWHIFNLGRWAAARQPACCSAGGPDLPPGALSLYVWAKGGRGEPIMRRLGMRTDQNDLYSASWCKSVEGIEFTGTYPTARLNYVDPDLPVQVSAVMFSPITPHDSRTSGTPGFHAIFQLTNATRQPVEASLAGVLANPVAWGAADRRLTNRVVQEGDTATLVMRTAAGAADGGAPAAAPQGCQATVGSMAMSLSGGTNSWVTGDFGDYCRGAGPLVWGAFGAVGAVRESLLRSLRLAGRLPNTDADASPASLLAGGEAEIDAMSDARRAEVIAELRRSAIFHDMCQRLDEVDASMLRSAAGQTTFLKAARLFLDSLAGEDRKRPAWGDGALCTTVRLRPGETREVCLTLGWHFPNHYSASGPVLGHMYENWFSDAEEVCRFLVANRDKQRAVTCGFAETLYDTTLEAELADAWSSQLSTLAKCTWWTKAGDFAVWEGLGCCGFHTTDITYQGSFSILALLPDLQKAQMELGARFQRDDGRVHHFFTPDLAAVDNGFDRVDMNQQFVLLVCRDWLWTGDEGYLRRMWPHVVKAMDSTAALDADGDGLPDRDTRRNTYDAWDFRGTPSYVASLWVSSLLAAARMAEDLGEAERAGQWRRTLTAATEAFDKKLWNGKYYSLWADGADRDECCMSDQIDGEWFTELIGLGHCLPPKRIRSALRAIVKHNFRDEDGLINASYPPGVRPTLSTHRNLQAEAPWTGIEYAMASMMFEFGLAAEATAVVRNIHHRYLRAGRFWSHVECGDHYYRAMSSWAVLLSATGFKMDVPRETLTIAPSGSSGKCRGPWVSATGWGQFRQTPRRFELACQAGSVSFRTLRSNISGEPAGAILDGRKLPATTARQAGLTVLCFDQPVTLAAGDVLQTR